MMRSFVEVASRWQWRHARARDRVGDEARRAAAHRAVHAPSTHPL